MSETGNIEKAAKQVYKDIFKRFKWKVCEPKDEDWACEMDHHSKKTHPSDVVFYYDEPYSSTRMYLNTDLKSYKQSSITSAKMAAAMKSLAMSVECANVSGEWADKFVIEEDLDRRVSGLLFVYNHDNLYDADFEKHMSGESFKDFSIPEGVRVCVFGPDRIRSLINIVNDIKNLQADELLPKEKDYSFFYPDLVTAKRHGAEWGQPATIETITSPWIIIKHRATEEVEEGFLIYYNRKGTEVEEFVYLLDALSHYQMMLSNCPIRIRLVDGDALASVNFNKAKGEYLKSWGLDEAREIQLNKVKISSITKVALEYKFIELGMEG